MLNVRENNFLVMVLQSHVSWVLPVLFWKSSGSFVLSNSSLARTSHMHCLPTPTYTRIVGLRCLKFTFGWGLTLGPLPQSDILLCMGLRLREGLLSSACPSGLSTQGEAYTRAMKSLVVGAVDIHDWCILRM